MHNSIKLLILLISLLNTTVLTNGLSSSDAIELFGYSSANCTSSIPSASYTVMQKLEDSAQSNYKYSVPEGYLQSCLHNITYDKDTSPFAYTQNAKFLASFALNSLVTLDFDGNLETKMTLHVEWTEPRLLWMTSVGSLKFWSYQSTVLYPAYRLWLPQFEVINCAAEECTVKIKNDSFVSLTSEGTIDVDTSFSVHSKCVLDLTYFPFDNQTCSIVMFVKNLILSSYAMQVNYTTFSTYIAESHEWVTNSMDYYVSSTQINDLIKNSASNWVQTYENIGNGTVIILFKMRRTNGYYLANIIIPLLVVELIGIFAVVVPGHCEEKPGLLLEIILAFCLYQLLLADALPKTNSVPYIGMNIMITMLLAALHLFSSALVFRLVNLHTAELPPLYLRVLCIRPVHAVNKFLARTGSAINQKLCKRRSPTVVPQTENLTAVNPGPANPSTGESAALEGASGKNEGRLAEPNEVIKGSSEVGEDGMVSARKTSLRYPSATPTNDENGSRERLAADSNSTTGALCNRSPSSAFDKRIESIEMHAMPKPGVDKPDVGPEASSLDLKTGRQDNQATVGDGLWTASQHSSTMLITPSGTVSAPELGGSPSLRNGEQQYGGRLMDSKATSGHGDGDSCAHEESWNVLGNYVNVLSGALYVVANIVIFCVYLVPLFSLYAINNQLSSYIK